MGFIALDHALAAASRGLAVFPLSRTKHPALRSPHRASEASSAAPGSPSAPGPLPCRGECGLYGHGVHDATSDPDEVRALFTAAPWATGYGIACGRRPLHLVGLDLDVKHGTDSLFGLKRLAREHGFAVPETTTVLTPSGGRHLWLRAPHDITVPNSAGRLAPGIDVRGHGGYLVGPGSATTCGTYRLAPGSLTRRPAPVPPTLLPLLLPASPAQRYGLGPGRTHSDGNGNGPAPGHGGGYGNDNGHGHGHSYEEDGGPSTALLHFVRGAAVGQRNARLFWAACRAYETGRGEELAEALVDAAVTTGLPAHEARSTVVSASHRAARFTAH